MTLSYNVGLTGGSLVAYVLDAMLGPPMADPCRSYMFVKPRTLLTNVTKVTQSTVMVVTTAAVTVTTALTTYPPTPATLTSFAAISLANVTAIPTNLTAH